MRRKQPLVAGQYYHLYNRGVDHRSIFLDRDCWSLFITLLSQYFARDLVQILAYCLMPNHYHLLVYLKTADFSQTIMQPFSVAFVKTVNGRHRRVGPLFQGPFKNQLVDSERYLSHLSRYIHLNPVSVGLAARPEDWIYSSYRDYIGLRAGTLPACETILQMFAPTEELIDDDWSLAAAQAAYAEFVVDLKDARAGLRSELLIDG